LHQYDYSVYCNQLRGNEAIKPGTKRENEMRKFYGIRYHGGNRTCTTGQPNDITGRMSIACNIEVFRARAERDEWVSKEKLSAPCGCDGGERIAATKNECRKHRLGETVHDFEESLEYAEMSRYQD
jgi:hypothetical protein